MNNNHLKIVTDNASTKPQSQQAMSSKSSSSGAVTPTSDFVDDSGVSEDNASSVNSGSEQGSSSSSSSSGSSSIYRSVRTTPKSFATTNRERDSDTVDNEDIDDANNNTIQKNRTNQVPPASNIIHLSPSGSSVIEYKTLSNLPQKSAVIPNISSPLSTINPVIVSTNNGTTTNGNTNVIKAISTQQSSTHSNALSATTTPHTHFHKKYIKAMNALNSSDTVATALTTTSIANSSQEAQISSSSTVVSISTPTTTIYTIPMQKEYRYDQIHQLHLNHVFWHPFNRYYFSIPMLHYAAAPQSTNTKRLLLKTNIRTRQ